MNIEYSNGVKITTDENGNQHFEVDIEDESVKQEDTRSWWQKFKDQCKEMSIKPYIKIRDLADPFGDRDDFDVGQDGINSAEIGIKGSF